MSKKKFLQEFNFLIEQNKEHLNYFSQFSLLMLPEKFQQKTKLTKLKMPNSTAIIEKIAWTKIKDCQNCNEEQFKLKINPDLEILLIADDINLNPENYFYQEHGQLLKNIIEKGFQKINSKITLAPLFPCLNHKNSYCQNSFKKIIKQKQPKVIMTMGKKAGRLFGQNPFKQVRGKWLTWHDIPMLITYSATEMLNEPSLKRKTWNDIKKIITYLETI